MSGRTKTLLPSTDQFLQLEASSPEEQRTKLAERQTKQKLDYDRHAKDFQHLSKVDVVRIKPFRPGQKDWRKVVVSIGQPDERSYTVETSDGGVYHRNHVHLNRTEEQPPIVQLDNEPSHATNLTSCWSHQRCSHQSILITPKHPLCQEWKNQPSSQASLKWKSTAILQRWHWDQLVFEDHLNAWKTVFATER